MDTLTLTHSGNPNTQQTVEMPQIAFHTSLSFHFSLLSHVMLIYLGQSSQEAEATFFYI